MSNVNVRRVGIWLAFFLCTLAISAPALLAQTPGTGALTGTVTDQSGGVVPNVTVTLTSVDTGQVRATMTGSDGAYSFNLLPPGNYSVKFDAKGFESVEVPSVTIVVTETEVLNRSLAVGTQTQSVTVQGEVEAVQTASSAVGTVVNDRTITELPLSTRNYTMLLAFTAGADALVVNSASLGKATVDIQVNGADLGQNAVLQDGVAVNNWDSYNRLVEETAAPAVAFPMPDDIQEFKIQTSNYDAGYGRNPGANVNVVTKSGTNDWHGTAFEFLRNTAFNANDFFRNADVGQPGDNGSKQVLNQNQYGGTIGGPVKKDKLFFFVAYQETKETNGISGFGNSTVILQPIPDNTPGGRGSCPVNFTSLTQCNAAGQAFVQALGAAMCPTNNPSDKSSISGGVQVACNGSNINPIAISMLQLPNSNEPSGYLIPGSGTNTAQSASFTDPALYHDHQAMGNWDYLINSKHTLSGRWFYDNEPVEGNFSSSGSTLGASSYLPGDPVSNQKNNEVALLRLTTIVSNSMVNEARVSYQRNQTYSQNLTPYTAAEVGITPISTQFPELYTFLTPNLDWGSGQNFGTHTLDEQFQWADQVSWTHGKHSMRTGVEVERIEVDTGLAGATAIPATKFNSFADFLIGLGACPAGTSGAGPGQCNANNPMGSNGSAGSSSIFSSSGGSSVVEGSTRKTDLSAFVQDDIKVNSRLTLNLGVRWEFFELPTSGNGEASYFLPQLGNVSTPGSGCVTPSGGVIGLGAAGTGCSLAGLAVPSNWAGGPLPVGVYQASNPYVGTGFGAPWDNFAPRVGFAWQPTGSGKVVVRGGGGYFYELVNGQGLAGFGNAEPYATVSQTNSIYSTLQNETTAPTLLPGPPGTFGWAPRYVNPATPSQNSNLSLGIISPNYTTPVTYEWNLDTQYQFAPNWVLDVAYVGTHGIHQITDSIIGNNAETPYNTPLLASAANPIVADGTTITTNTAANAPLRSPYLGIAQNVSAVDTGYNYKYNALQTTVRKRFSYGLQLQVAYTWSKTMQQGTYGVNYGDGVANQYGPNPLYHPQRVVFQYVYDLPVHRAGIEGKFLNDWAWSGVTTLQSGAPLSFWDSRDGTVFGSLGTATGLLLEPAQFCPGMGTANALSSGSTLQRATTSWFNNASGVFCAPPALGTDGSTGFGDSGIGTFLGPGEMNWDMSLTKNIRVGGIHEGAMVQFRWEVFNVMNHPNFSLPISNSGNLNAALNVDSPSFGKITSTQTSPRIMQFALKYVF